MFARISNNLHGALEKLDGAAVRLARAATTWAPWPVLISIGIGVGGWAARHKALLTQLDGNKLAEPDRRWMLASIGAAFAGVCLFYFLIMLGRRTRTGSWRFLDTVTRLNGYLAPLIALPIVAAFRVPNFERDSLRLTLFLIALCSAIAGASVYTWGRHDPPGHDLMPDPAWRAALESLGRKLAPFGVAALWAGYGVLFSYFALTNHHALVTRTTDLGYYDNIFYQSAHGRPLGCSFIKAGYHGSAHFDPILVVLSPLYRLYPRAEFLLVLQSVWLGAGVVPVYLLANDKLAHRGKALLLALAWAIYPAMHGANMYEFHSLTLISPLVVWLLYFYETRRDRLYWPTLLALLLCREDVALLMCFVGLYAILDRQRSAPRLGWTTIAASIVYFAVVKVFFMTSAGIFMSGKDAYSFAYYYEALMPNHSGLGGLLVSIVTNPVFTLKTILEEQKVLFFLELFLPLVFLPFLEKPGRWMLAYGILFCHLASRDAVFSPHFQYTSVIFPIAFALTPAALKRVEEGRAFPSLPVDGRRLERALLAALLVASALVSWKFGAIVDNATFKGGFSRIARSLTPEQKDTYAWVREQVAKIPPEASVATSNKLGAHVSNRKEAYFYGADHFNTDYVFIDETEIRGKDADQHSAALARGELVELGRLGKMALFQRKMAPAGQGSASAAPSTAPAAPTSSSAPHGAPERRGVDLKPFLNKIGAATAAPSSTAEQNEDPPSAP